ncbi:MAG: glycosyltransferase family 39 protein [Cytophagales bacterium]|nr:glycosyltransferase family 39 protein [Cytophagales bacterium]
MLQRSNPRHLALWIIGISTLFRLYLAAFTGLSVGESYYWRGAQFLQLSYFDQPPLFLWLSGITIRLLDISNFALRLPAVLLFSGTSYLLYQIGARLFNPKVGLVALILLNISFVFTIPVASWFQPDAPLMFFWLMTTWGLIQVFFPKEPNGSSFKWWIFIGVALGFTTLSKYHALFLMASTFLFVVINPGQRRWLKHPGPYLALLITAIMLTPVLLWNAEHQWVSFNFQGSRAGGYQVDFTRLIRSIVGQMAWIAPWIWFPLIIVLFKTVRSTEPSQKESFLFWLAILPIVFFTFIAPFARIGFHFHWQAPGYLIAFLLLGNAVAKNLENNQRSTRKWLRSSIAITLVFTLLLTVHMTTGFWSAFGPKLVGEQFGNTTDPTMEGVDFTDIRKRFEQEGWLKNDNLFVATEKWWQTGKIDWPLRGEKDVLIFHPDPRNHAYFFEPKAWLGKDAIYVRYKKEDRPPSSHVVPFFESIKQLPDLPVIRYSKTELVMEVFYCKGFKIPAQARWDLPIYRRLLDQEPF